MKKQTATITFHASHNYGSMLQAYALQQTLFRLGVENDIINLRLPSQRAMYPHPSEHGAKGVKSRIKRVLLNCTIPKYEKQIEQKYRLFEDFLQDKLKLTSEIQSREEIKNLKKYDFYITGSDQCWNTDCHDFDWSYYLDFTDSPNKIAYAASLGPNSSNKKTRTMAKKIKEFKAISVREKDTANVIETLTGNVPVILPDPTLLLECNEWMSLVGNEPIFKGQYIFMYMPYFLPDTYEIASGLSKELKIPLVISNISTGIIDIIHSLKNTTYLLNTGPIEFLNLIANAESVISGSFHALVFSILFHTPFWAVNGDKDNRMKQLLDTYGFSDRTIHLCDAKEKYKVNNNINFFQFETAINNERTKAINFLRTNLNI